METEKPDSSKNRVSPFLRFTTLGIQMGVIIAFFTWLGIYLDGNYQSVTPWWTIGLSLFGVCASLYLVIKEVIKMGKNEK
jgi:ATP synthase protein I